MANILREQRMHQRHHAQPADKWDRPIDTFLIDDNCVCTCVISPYPADPIAKFHASFSPLCKAHLTRKVVTY